MMIKALHTERLDSEVILVEGASPGHRAPDVLDHSALRLIHCDGAVVPSNDVML
jgi:hypothetical protein